MGKHRTLAMWCGMVLATLGVRDLKAAASDDPYAPLRLYEGKWEVTTTVGGQGVMHLENHCAQTGVFFVCEQSLEGKPGTLVVFLPVNRLPSGGEEYRNTALRPDGSAPGSWNKLVIEGERWIYSWDEEDAGKKTLWRNVNQFFGRDKIHFEVQKSEDGKTWKTVKGGDEKRGW
jgi:hypothetical protein